MKSYNDVIIVGRKRGNNKKKKDIDEELIDDTNTTKVEGKDVRKDIDSVDNIHVEYLNDEKIQNDNVIVQRSAEDAEVLAEFRSNNEWEKINMAVYDPTTLSWVTQLSKRAILKNKTLNYELPAADVQYYKDMYTNKPPSMYRPPNVKLPIDGLFEFCGCDVHSCTRNVCSASHACGYCCKRMEGFCFKEPGMWGCCRQCFIKHHLKPRGTTRTAIIAIPGRKKQPINAPVPVPVPVEEDVVLPTDTPLLPIRLTSRISAGKKRKHDSDSDFVSSDDEDDNDDDPFDDVAPPSRNQGKQSLLNQGVIAYETKGGIIIPPKMVTEYNVDEIAHLSDQSLQTTTDNLWYLACNLVYDSVAKDAKEKSTEVVKKGTKPKSTASTAGKDMTKTDRFQLYYFSMEGIMKNYHLKTDGAAVLRYFNLEGHDDIPAWPSEVINVWETTKSNCRLNCPKWESQQNCPLTKEEKDNLAYDIKAIVYAGMEINDIAKATTSFANGYANKQWPQKLRSGESPAALLQAIRHEYYTSVEAVRLATGTMKSWKYSRTKSGLSTTDQEYNRRLQEQKKKYVFLTGWYPPEWYVINFK